MDDEPITGDSILNEIKAFNESLKTKSKHLVDVLKGKLAEANNTIRALRSEHIDHPIDELLNLKEVKDFNLLVQFSVSPKPGKRRGRKPGSTNKVKVETVTKPKRKISAAHRKAIAAAQRARWAKVNPSHGIPREVLPPAKKKKGMSAAGRAKIAAAQRARWAKVKAAKK
jgi:hypothetical protein